MTQCQTPLSGTRRDCDFPGPHHQLCRWKPVLAACPHLRAVVPKAATVVLEAFELAVKEESSPTERAGWKPALGAAIVTLGAISLSIGFLTWRGREQRRVLDARQTTCTRGDSRACDLLRGACLKRSADACVSLANSYLASGPNHDEREGQRLLGDACVLHDGRACLRVGRMYLEANDAAQARTMLDRGCDYGAHEACALRQTIP